jgi:hypothetical protein
MTIEYDLTSDDVVEFARHLLRTDPAHRRGYQLGFLAGPVFGLLFLFATGHHGALSTLLKLLSPTLLFSAFYMKFYRQQVADNVRRAYGVEGGLLGKKRLTLSATGFEEWGERSTTNQLWSGVRGIQESPTGIYLMVAPGAAYIVPKRAFATLGGSADFLEAVARYRGTEAA